MKDLVAASVQHVLFHGMVYFYVLLFTANALCGAIIASFLNVEWSDLSPTSKFLVCVGIGQIWTGTMLAFFNKTIGRLEKGEPIIQDQDSLSVTSTSTTSVTKTNPPPNP